MHIAIVGYYGHNNAGDDRMLHCIQNHFYEHKFFIISGFGDVEAKIELINSCDFVLIGGGGLILRGFGKYAAVIDQIKPKIGCIGISIESKHPDNQELINILLDKSEFILVRDHRSKKLLGENQKIILGPDITYLNPYETIEPISQDTCGVNLRKWHFWHWEYGGTISNYLNTFRSYVPRIESIYPLPKWSSNDFLEITEKKFTELIPIPLYTIPKKRKSDISVLGNFFKNVPDFFEPDSYRTCRHFIGMRLHSIIFASQMGIPFLSLSYQPKNIEFCKSAGLINLSIDIYNLTDLDEKIDFLKANYHTIRNQLISHTDEKNREINLIMDQIAPMIANN